MGTPPVDERPAPNPVRESALPTSWPRKKLQRGGVEGRAGRWSSESAGAFSGGREGQAGGRPHRQSWHKATWPFRKSRQGQSRWYLVLEPAQLKSRGSFCRKHWRPGWAKAGYRWFVSDSVLSQGTCSLDGHRGQRSRPQPGTAPSPPWPIPSPSREDVSGGHQAKPRAAAPSPGCERGGQEGGWAELQADPPGGALGLEDAGTGSAEAEGGVGVGGDWQGLRFHQEGGSRDMDTCPEGPFWDHPDSRGSIKPPTAGRAGGRAVMG